MAKKGIQLADVQKLLSGTATLSEESKKDLQEFISKNGGRKTSSPKGGTSKSPPSKKPNLLLHPEIQSPNWETLIQEEKSNLHEDFLQKELQNFLKKSRTIQGFYQRKISFRNEGKDWYLPEIVLFGPKGQIRILHAGGLYYGFHPLYQPPTLLPNQKPGSANSTERKFSNQLETARRKGEIQGWKFEAISLKLGEKTWYFPDFLVIDNHERIHIVEIKGFLRDDSAAKFKIAASNFPEMHFHMFKNQNGSWKKMYRTLNTKNPS